MKKMNIKVWAKIVSVLLILAATTTACVKDNFSIQNPGANVDPAGVKATLTIKQFKQQYYVPVLSSALPVLINDSVVIEGIINADDKSGNFYKTISLQDSTGGIQLKIDASKLYYTYPIGRRIWIKLKGLYIFNYGGTAEIGGFIDLSGTYPSVGGVLPQNTNNCIITGKWGLEVPVTKTTIQNLINADPVNMQSMLYQIDDVEFGLQDTAGLYVGNIANELIKSSFNVVLNDCATPANSMVVRTSGYANFATAKVSPGHGSIKGIYTYYSYSNTGNTQLIVRDTTDIQFTGTTRCH